MTSNSGLPENVWTEEMDAFICYEYALDEYNVEEITTALLHEFPILSHVRESLFFVVSTPLFLYQGLTIFQILRVYLSNFFQPFNAIIKSIS